jgi:hypothetical protein
MDDDANSYNSDNNNNNNNNNMLHAVESRGTQRNVNEHNLM